jgi:hypothetical protein
MPDNTPEAFFVTVACFCQTVIEGKDDIISCIRIIDSVAYVPAPDEQPLPPLHLNGVVSVKTNGPPGNRAISIDLYRPNSDSPEAFWKPIEVDFSTPSADKLPGLTIVLGINVPVKSPGVYAFAVKVDNREVARIPLIVYQVSEAEVTSQPSSYQKL